MLCKYIYGSAPHKADHKRTSRLVSCCLLRDLYISFLLKDLIYMTSWHRPIGDLSSHWNCISNCVINRHPYSVLGARVYSFWFEIRFMSHSRTNCYFATAFANENNNSCVRCAREYCQFTTFKTKSIATIPFFGSFWWKPVTKLDMHSEQWALPLVMPNCGQYYAAVPMIRSAIPLPATALSFQSKQTRTPRFIWNSRA